MDSEHIIRNALSALRRGDFTGLTRADVANVAEVTQALEHLAERGIQEEKLYLRGLCIQSEWHDYFEEYEAAEGVILPCASGLRYSIDQFSLESRDERELFCQRIWLLVHLAHTVYRKHDLEGAASILQTCQENLGRQAKLVLPANWNYVHPVTSQRRSPDERPPFGLWSRVKYSTALVTRQLENLDEARDLYVQAMDLQNRRLEDRLARASDEATKTAEKEYSNYFIAKCLFGLGNISVRSGILSRARGSLAASRSMLRGTGDDLHRGYANLLHIQSLRGAAHPGAELDGLIEWLESLAKDLKLFPSYRLRARIELCRVYLHLLQGGQDLVPKADAAGMREKASREIDEVIQDASADPKKNGVWAAHGYVLKGRFLMNEANFYRPASERDATLAEARESLKQVTDGRAGLVLEPAVKVTAKIALAEAYIESAKTHHGDFEGTLLAAEKLLEDTLEIQTSRMNRGVCYLHLARIEVRRSDYEKATARYRRWEETDVDTENGFVRALAADLKKEIFGVAKRLIFDERDWPFRYEDMEKKLRSWALDVASVKLQEKFGTQGPEILDISRGAFFMWRRDLNTHPPKKRTKKPRLEEGSAEE